MASDRDRRLLAVAQRWKLDAERRARYIRGLDVALSLAVEKRDPGRINGCVRTLAILEGQNQADEHLAIKLAAGQPLEGEDRRIEVVYNEWPALEGADDDE